MVFCTCMHHLPSIPCPCHSSCSAGAGRRPQAVRSLAASAHSPLVLCRSEATSPPERLNERETSQLQDPLQSRASASQQARCAAFSCPAALNRVRQAGQSCSLHCVLHGQACTCMLLGQSSQLQGLLQSRASASQGAKCAPEASSLQLHCTGSGCTLWLISRSQPVSKLITL